MKRCSAIPTPLPRYCGAGSQPGGGWAKLRSGRPLMMLAPLRRNCSINEQHLILDTIIFHRRNNDGSGVGRLLGVRCERGLSTVYGPRLMITRLSGDLRRGFTTTETILVGVHEI